MNTKLFAGCALLFAGAALSGCAGLNSGASSDLLKQMDVNFAGCERHFTIQAGLGVVMPGAQISGSVDCKGGTGPLVPAADDTTRQKVGGLPTAQRG